MIARNANSSTQNPATMAPVASQVAGWSGARTKRVTMPRSRSASSGPKAPRTRSSPRSRSGTPITRGRSRAAGAASRSRRRRTVATGVASTSAVASAAGPSWPRRPARPRRTWPVRGPRPARRRGAGSDEPRSDATRRPTPSATNRPGMTSPPLSQPGITTSARAMTPNTISTDPMMSPARPGRSVRAARDRSYSAFQAGFQAGAPPAA